MMSPTPSPQTRWRDDPTHVGGVTPVPMVRPGVQYPRTPYKTLPSHVRESTSVPVTRRGTWHPCIPDGMVPTYTEERPPPLWLDKTRGSHRQGTLHPTVHPSPWPQYPQSDPDPRFIGSTPRRRWPYLFYLSKNPSDKGPTSLHINEAPPHHVMEHNHFTSPPSWSLYSSTSPMIGGLVLCEIIRKSEIRVLPRHIIVESSTTPFPVLYTRKKPQYVDTLEVRRGIWPESMVFLKSQEVVFLISTGIKITPYDPRRTNGKETSLLGRTRSD